MRQCTTMTPFPFVTYTCMIIRIWEYAGNAKCTQDQQCLGSPDQWQSCSGVPHCPAAHFNTKISIRLTQLWIDPELLQRKVSAHWEVYSAYSTAWGTFPQLDNLTASLWKSLLVAWYNCAEFCKRHCAFWKGCSMAIVQLLPILAHTDLNTFQICSKGSLDFPPDSVSLEHHCKTVLSKECKNVCNGGRNWYTISYTLLDLDLFLSLLHDQRICR